MRLFDTENKATTYALTAKQVCIKKGKPAYAMVYEIFDDKPPRKVLDK